MRFDCGEMALRWGKKLSAKTGIAVRHAVCGGRIPLARSRCSWVVTSSSTASTPFCFEICSNFSMVSPHHPSPLPPPLIRMLGTFAPTFATILTLFVACDCLSLPKNQCASVVYFLMVAPDVDIGWKTDGCPSENSLCIPSMFSSCTTNIFSLFLPILPTTPRHTILQIPTLIICFPTVTNIPIGVAKIAAQTTRLKASIIVASQIATAPTKTFW
jgi:hypothetical protein